MVKVRTEPYKRDTETYSMTPQEKARMWEQIVEAAKVVIAHGGGGIRFTAPLDDSERYYREKNRREQKWLRETNSPN